MSNNTLKMDLRSSSSSISSGTITDNRGRPTSRGGSSSPITRERSRSSCRTDVFLPKSSHIHVKRQESDRSNRDRITRFASPSRSDYNRHEVIVPRVQQSYHTSLSAVVPAQRFIADKENQDDYSSSEGSSRDIFNTSRDSDKGSYYSEVEGANYWNNRRNARPYASLPVSKGHILNDRVQALNRRADELIKDHCIEQERFRQELYDIATGKPPKMSQNSGNDTTSSSGSSPLKSPSPSRSPPQRPGCCSTPKSKDKNANDNGDYSALSGDSSMQSASFSDSALQNGAVGVGSSSSSQSPKEVKVSRSASERSHCTTNGSAKDNFSKRTVGPQYYFHEKKVTYYDLVEKFGDIGDDPEARVAMKEMGMLKGSEPSGEPQSVPSTPKSNAKSETQSDVDAVSTSSSKKSLAVTISNFIKKMSPRMHRKSSRSSEKSCSDDGNTSGSSSVSGSPAHKPSRSKSPLSSPIRKLMGHSGRRSREQSPVSASRSNSSENDSGDRSESSSQRSDKSGQKFDNNTRVMLKSIEDNRKTEKSVYQNFKGRQKSGDAELKPKRVNNKISESEKQPVRVKKASDSEAPTVLISEVSTTAQPMRSPPPQSLNIRSISRLSKKSMKSTVSSDSIGECSLDVTMTGSEPSIASGNGHHSSSVSKHTLLSQDNIGAPIGQNARHQSSSDSELTNIAAQTERDDSGKVQSYVHLSCALGGYNSSNKYTTYSPDDKKVGKNNTASSLVKSDGVKIEANGIVPEVNGHVCVPEQNGGTQRDSVIQDDDVFVTGTQTADRTVTKPPQNMVISRQPVATSPSADVENRLSSSGDKHVVISTEPGLIPDSNSLDKSTPKDGNYYLDVVRRETVALEALSARAEEDLKTLETNPDVSEEVCGIIRAAIGKAKLLVTQKFEQFKGLCHENLTPDPSTSLQTTCEDLGGFWDMVLLQVEDVQNMFQDINEMKNNGWKVVVKVVTVKRTLSSSSQKSNDGSHAETKTGVARPKTPRGNMTPKPKTKVAADRDKAREEARKRLMEAKKAARRKRMNSQSNDEVEIFISDPHATAQAN